MDWGHSCIEDVVAMAKYCKVGHTYIGHHDPNRPWAEKKSIDEKLRTQAGGDDVKYEMARAETVIEL
jgi:phosphoribosyl 1,2-cyclic phosphodiesterase